MKKKPDHQNERDDHTDRYFDLAVHAARSQTVHEAPIPLLRPCTSGNSLRTELRAQTRIPSPTSNAGAVRPMIGLVPIVRRTRSGRRLVMVGNGARSGYREEWPLTVEELETGLRLLRGRDVDVDVFWDDHILMRGR